MLYIIEYYIEEWFVCLLHNYIIIVTCTVYNIILHCKDYYHHYNLELKTN